MIARARNKSQLKNINHLNISAVTYIVECWLLELFTGTTAKMEIHPLGQVVQHTRLVHCFLLFHYVIISLNFWLPLDYVSAFICVFLFSLELQELDHMKPPLLDQRGQLVGEMLQETLKARMHLQHLLCNQ